MGTIEALGTSPGRTGSGTDLSGFVGQFDTGAKAERGEKPDLILNKKNYGSNLQLYNK